MNRPDVLVVGDVDSVHIHRLVAGLQERGDFEVRTAGFSERSVAGRPSIRLGWGRTPPTDIQFLLAVPRLAQLLRRLRPAIVNAHYVSSYGLLTALALRLAFPRPPRPALVQTAWGTDLLVTAQATQLHVFLARIALSSADLVTGDSLDLEEAVHAIVTDAPFERFVFGPPEALLVASRFDQPIILSSRRLDPDTRIPLIIEGFRHAQAMAPEMLADWRLVVAGTGSMRRETQLRTAGDPTIEFVGQLDRRSLDDLLTRSSSFISIPVSDATSAALLEAMAAGVIPIVNDLPANREWVDASVGVILPRDPAPEAIASAIIAVIDRAVDRELIRSAVADVTWERELDRLTGRFRALRDSDAVA